MAAQAEPVLAELGLDVPLRRPVSELSLAQRQLIEIAKALLTRPRVLILDEPTSALDDSGAQRLLGILEVLRQQTVLEAIAGLRPAAKGTLRLPGANGRASTPPRGLRRAVRQGTAMVSGDRRLGLMLDKPIWHNVIQVRSVALAGDGAVLRARTLRKRAWHRIQQLGVRTTGVDQEAGMLSGGNQQKVVLAKWLEAAPRTLLLDDPTRGVDVGAKAEMHELIRAACTSAAVLLCSTDLDELVALCDRVLVFRRGRIAAQLAGSELNRHRLLTEMNASDSAGEPQ